MKISQIWPLLILCFFLTACVETKTNRKSKDLMTSALGNNTEVSLEGQVHSNFDTIIEFKRNSNGNQVCTFPSGKCRTNQDAYSGGASLYGDIPGSSHSFIHFMKFRLYSNGYFAKNPDGHFAFGLRGQYLSYEKYKEKAGHDGKGLIFGAIGFGYAPNKNNPSCVTKMLQAESLFKSYQLQANIPNANNIFPTTCSDSILEDYKWYTVEIEVTSHHYIIYKVFDANGSLIHKNYYNDLPNYKDSNLTGWFIGHVFGNENTEWSIRMEDFIVGHIPTGNVLYPVKDFSPSIYISNNNMKIKHENSNNYSLVINKNSPANIKLHNVVSRTRVWGCANFRKTKTSSDNMDCNNWQNYREIKLSSDADWIYQGDKLVLRTDFLKSMPNQFYTVYFRLNPQDELSQVSMSFELEGVSSNSGTFCDKNNKTLTSWVCGGSQPDSTWVNVGGGCYHLGSTVKCVP